MTRSHQHPPAGLSAPENPSSAAGLSIRKLRVELLSTGDPVISDIDLDLARGRLLGVVGESGSGKTTFGLALLGHVRPGLRMAADSLRIGGVELADAASRRLRRERGRLVSYVPQDAASALNPSRRIGRQIRELLEVKGWRGSVEDRITELMDEVNLPGGREFLQRFPFELSGGQQQRVGIAMAFACRPTVVVMDEPTTGLDVVTQTRVLATVKALVDEHQCTGFYISHDLSVVSGLVDEVAVMYAGSLVERGSAHQIFASPRHPYTSRLIASVPEFPGDRPLSGIPGSGPSVRHRLPGCQFASRCAHATPDCSTALPVLEGTDAHAWRCIRPLDPDQPQQAAVIDDRQQSSRGGLLVEVSQLSAQYSKKTVLHAVDLTIHRGQCLGLLGESGSGKTTLSRLLAGVAVDGDGTMTFDDTELARGSLVRTVEQRRRIGYVFQNPYTSLNPRRRIGESVAAPLKRLGVKDRGELHRRALHALDMVTLPAELMDKYPRELSGGERQRAAIARALVTDPEFLICDEVTSALDVSVQASIVGLLNRLRRETGLTLLFVTHDIALLSYLADEIAVLRDGEVVERGAVERVLTAPKHPYTQELIINARHLAGTTSARPPIRKEHAS